MYEEFKPIKQPPNSEICLACVMAMATNTTLNQVYKIVGKKDCYTDKDLIAYLLYYGYYLGSGFPIKSSNLRKNSKLLTSFSLKGNPAYIVVTSQVEEDGLHAIYWNGYAVYDPNPYIENELPLNTYDIIEIYPIREFILISPATHQKYEGITP